MSKILAAIDDSAAAKPVLAVALALAPVVSAQVEAVHVADVVGRTTQETARAMNVHLHELCGDPFEQICRLVEADDDVVGLIVGARARPAGRRPAGHLALALADRMTKPVVIVPPDASPGPRLRRVVVAMAGTPGTARDMHAVVNLAAAGELELVVVHVDDEESIPSFCDQVQYETEAYANEFISRYFPGAPAARLVLRIGVPADEILAVAEDVQPDLLAIGWPHRDDPDRGPVAHEIVTRSRVPVLAMATTNSHNNDNRS